MTHPRDAFGSDWAHELLAFTTKSCGLSPIDVPRWWKAVGHITNVDGVRFYNYSLVIDDPNFNGE